MATGTTRKTTSTARKPATRSTRTTKSTTAAKAAAAATKTTAKPAAAKPATASAPASAASNPVPASTPSSEAAPIPKVVKVSEPAAAQPDMKKKELLEEVVVRSGIKKKDAKPVVEAMLEILGGALADGRELNIQPFGKLRINRAEEHANYRIIVCKLRQQTGLPVNADDPLADAAE